MLLMELAMLLMELVMLLMEFAMLPMEFVMLPMEFAMSSMEFVMLPMEFAMLLMEPAMLLLGFTTTLGNPAKLRPKNADCGHIIAPEPEIPTPGTFILQELAEFNATHLPLPTALTSAFSYISSPNPVDG